MTTRRKKVAYATFTKTNSVLNAIKQGYGSIANAAKATGFSEGQLFGWSHRNRVPQAAYELLNEKSATPLPAPSGRTRLQAGRPIRMPGDTPTVTGRRTVSMKGAASASTPASAAIPALLAEIARVSRENEDLRATLSRVREALA